MFKNKNKIFKWFLNKGDWNDHACDTQNVFRLLKDILALVLQMSHNESEEEVKALEVGWNENVCTMCEEFAAEAIKYLVENKTQLEIIDVLHKTCSQLVPLEQQVVTHF